MTCAGNYIDNFFKTNVKGWTLYLRKGFTRESVRDLCESVIQTDGIQGPFEPVQSSRFSRVTKSTVSFHGRCHKLYLKEYRYRSVWDVIKHFFRPSRAGRAFTAALMLEKNGLCSPEIVALGELRCGLFYAGNFLVTRELTDAEEICHFGKNDLRSAGTLREKREFVKQLGNTIGQMHRAGIFHGDLRIGNIFAKRSKGQWRFFFLDNERTKKYHRLPKRLRLKNLVQINFFINPSFTGTDRMRFFKAYREQCFDGRDKLQDFARNIMSKTHKRLKNKAFSRCLQVRHKC
jgi:tRNA A-37 threonylcarbamoyl transferase component Bud32